MSVTSRRQPATVAREAATTARGSDGELVGKMRRRKTVGDFGNGKGGQRWAQDREG